MAITLTKRTVRLNHYHPNTVYPSKEFESLSFLGDLELNKIWDEIWQWMLNTFVYELDTQGAARWESMLNLRPEISDTLDIRRRRILAKINSAMPYTERSFQAMLNGIYGEDNVKLKVLYDSYAISLSITPKMPEIIGELKQFARAIIPANLEIFFENETDMRGDMYIGGFTSVHKTVNAGIRNVQDTELLSNVYIGGMVSVERLVSAGLSKAESVDVEGDMFTGGSTTVYRSIST